ncbi:MAG: tetratricopeptide repeat protein [Chloroflexi bacterium]|nr:tetratricopeptide repeat protein [Chloroflexota bacterium]
MAKERSEKALPDRRRQHDPERVRRAVENLERLLREHDWRWTRQSREFLARLKPSETGADVSQAQMELEGEREGVDKAALEEAQELICEAWEQTGKRRVALARAALEICRDCADAYVILGEEAESWEEACNYFRRGVEAAERALGLEAFVKHAGHFWNLFEARPYMRAKLSLADCLFHSGQYEEAVQHFEELLHLNPNDNQGVRYWYALCLFAMNDNEALGRLLDRYAWDVTAPWTYTRALWAYRVRGPGRARTALQRALESNPYVPDYLLGRKEIPRDLPDYVGIGSDEEAAAVAEAIGEAWEETPGALNWLRESLPKRPDHTSREKS